MGTVKWFMFNVHFWSALLDVTLSLLVIPYMLFPAAAGYALGLFTMIGMDLALQTTVVVIEIGMTVLSILVLFENRYTFLAGSNKLWIRARRIFIGFCYVVACTYFIPFNFMVPDQSLAGPSVIQRLRTLRCFYSGPIFVLTQDATVVAWTTAVKLLAEFTFIIALVILTFLNILKKNKVASLSKNTMALQKKFFVSITIQTAIPIAVIIIPLVYCAYSLAYEFYSQAMNNLCFLVISSHGLVSTIAMLLIHEPYRNVLFRWGKAERQSRTMSISIARSFNDRNSTMH
ncbi:hypothetical protein GCK72_020202 [Caenorhabditis remanei]|uniref:Serpentine Receptor, class H n=1 Tax=Caenorhabditis remanei TaxID=31234 RepID=A0A6A5GG70_CAERE|nr:hypothetical protein GCK72_020202 [Caenorhabditis remanei]KAF1753645.1 hypothetical protein GCK72_020202 [Caenorhabditis remanei]